MRIWVVLAAMFGWGPACLAESVVGDYIEQKGDQAQVLRVSRTDNGIRAEVMEFGKFLPAPYELQIHEGGYWGHGVADTEVLLSTTDGWKSADLAIGFHFGEPRQQTISKRHFARTTSTTAAAGVAAQDAYQKRKSFTRAALGDFRLINEALESYAEHNPPTVDPKVIRRMWGVEKCTPVHVPDDSWLAGCWFGYQVTMEQQGKARPVFTVHGVGMSPETKGITCTLDSRAGSELQCSGI